MVEWKSQLRSPCSYFQHRSFFYTNISTQRLSFFMPDGPTTVLSNSLLSTDCFGKPSGWTLGLGFGMNWTTSCCFEGKGAPQCLNTTPRPAVTGDLMYRVFQNLECSFFQREWCLVFTNLCQVICCFPDKAPAQPFSTMQAIIFKNRQARGLLLAFCYGAKLPAGSSGTSIRD